MVADEVQERLIAHERGRAVQGLAVSSGRGLFDELQHPRIIAGRLAIDWLAAATDNDRHLLDARGNYLFQNDLQSCFFRAIEVHEAL
jgi:hypothetical protein